MPKYFIEGHIANFLYQEVFKMFISMTLLLNIELFKSIVSRLVTFNSFIQPFRPGTQVGSEDVKVKIQTSKFHDVLIITDKEGS